ncbi:MAG: hypothetical protein GY874_08875 [Desulfobacteraceae bacterium]|nr:hypothetical protein [Desulfobacteraceae bacterium]
MRRSCYIILAVVCIRIAAALVANAASVDAASDASALAIAPYLMQVTQQSAVAGFHLKSKAIAGIRVFFDNGTFRDFMASQPRIAHFIPVSGLSACTAYRYQVITADGPQTPENSTGHLIKTSCAPGNSFSFAVYGDTRPGDNQTDHYHREVIDQILQHSPDFAIILGDMVDDGSQPDLWREFFGIEAELFRKTAVYPVIGDNDHATGEGLFASYFPGFAKGYYTFVWGNAHFFALNAWDAAGRQPREQLNTTSEQITWFVEQVSKPEAQKAAFRVVFMHDPAYISRGRASSLLIRQWRPLFEKYNIDVVFASWHLYERSLHKGVTYIISGGGGAELIWIRANTAYPSLADARDHHFVRVDVTAETMSLKAVSKQGAILDEITLTPRSRAASAPAAGLEPASQSAVQNFWINGRDAPKLDLVLFATNCGFCRRILDKILPSLADQYTVAFKVTYVNLDLEGTYDLFQQFGAAFGNQNAALPAIFMGSRAFGGENEIDLYLEPEIQNFLADPRQYRRDAIKMAVAKTQIAQPQEKRFAELSHSKTAAAGFYDVFNPLVISIAILLAMQLRLAGVTTARQVSTIAIFAVTAALAALAVTLGLGTSFAEPHQLSTARSYANFFAAALLAVSAVFIFLEGIKHRQGKTGIAPTRIKTSRRRRAAVIAAFACGALAGPIELIYAGHTYQSAAAMTSVPEHRIAAVTYLMVYHGVFAGGWAALLGLFCLGFRMAGRAAAKKTIGPAVLAVICLMLIFGAIVIVIHTL